MRKTSNELKAILREAMALNPTAEEPRLVLAEYLASRFGLSRAETVLMEASHTQPDSLKIKFGLGKLYQLSGQREQARELYQHIIEEWETKPPGLEAKVKLATLGVSGGKL